MSRTLLTSLLALFFGSLIGCGEGVVKSTEPEVGVEKEREKKARQLFVTASVKSHTDKIPYLKKLISLYPESSLVPQAHMKIIQVLLHPTINRADEALANVRVFAHRHPTHSYAVEVWYWMALHWKDDTDRGPKIRTEWKAWLDETRGRDDLDDPDFKAFLWLHSAYAANWTGDKQAALELLNEASEWEIPDKGVQALIALRTGSYRADLGDRAEARAAFEKALQLAQDGAKGVSVEAIRNELKGLLSDGK